MTSAQECFVDETADCMQRYPKLSQALICKQPPSHLRKHRAHFQNKKLSLSTRQYDKQLIEILVQWHTGWLLKQSK